MYKPIVAAAARSAVMDADNHFKNGEMKTVDRYKTGLKCLIRRALILAFSFVFISVNSYSQRFTENPAVDSDSSDETSIMPITAVITGVGDRKLTLVTLNYATTLFQAWIAIASETYVTTDRSTSKLQILEWGVIMKDHDEKFVTLNFNERYSVQRRTPYELFMVFPEIPENATVLNIHEPVTNGFFWTGIHLNSQSVAVAPNKEIPAFHPPPKPDASGSQGSSDVFTPTGSGSGFAISNDGYIATCYHVISGARAIRVRGINGDFEKAYDVKVVSTDEGNDLAILKVDNANMAREPYAFASSQSDVGETVFVLGFPQTQNLGEELKLTTGVISSRSGFRGDVTTYQVSAQVLPGNSGGPLFDGDGKIIGIVNAKYIEPNVSYAVKMSFLNALIEKSNINLRQPVNNVLVGNSLAEQVRIVRNHIYIIEVQ